MKPYLSAIPFAALSLFAIPASAVEQLPNLSACPAKDIQLKKNPQTGRTLLRFSATSWNSGKGPLELVAGPRNWYTGKQKVYQRIYSDDGSHRDILAGSFIWHWGHNHVHFQDYALYRLDPVDASSASSRISNKTSFCLMDSAGINMQLSGAPQEAVYDTCGRSVQGISVGWGDIYRYDLPGQAFDVTNLPSGSYKLKIKIDPKTRLLESNEASSDNMSVVTIELDMSVGTVAIMNSTPQCGG